MYRLILMPLRYLLVRIVLLYSPEKLNPGWFSVTTHAFKKNDIFAIFNVI